MIAEQARRRARLATLTIEATVALVLFDIARYARFGRLHEAIRGYQPRPRPAGPSAADIIWAVDEACVWYVKRVACLQRSAVGVWLLRRHGTPAELVIGYRPIPFESHAWIEVDGQVVNDRPQYQTAFMVLDRL